jgi:hypothetical protein
LNANNAALMEKTGLIQADIKSLRNYALASDVTAINACIKNLFLDGKYSVAEIKKLHDDLLFTRAYAPNNEIYFACTVAIELITELVSTGDHRLQDTGLRNSVTISAFSYKLIKWMIDKFPGKIIFHSFDEQGKDVGEMMKIVLPVVEAESLSHGWDKNKLFSFLCGGKISIEKIISIFGNVADEKQREFFFSQLGVYTEVHLSGKVISRTTARCVDYKPFFHNEFLKKVGSNEIISSPLPLQRKLNVFEKNSLVTNSRMMLAALGRETDPLTNTAEAETEFYVLERGFSIALFALDQKYRLALDAYIGFMMYKNGLPVAYGGAWVFSHRALIGVNIFDAYRGGESAFIFSQLLRVYHQRYSVNRFSVEPYQYGKDNPEGISSGAYWFYYRFGFRSDDDRLRQIATEEKLKIDSQKGYKTSPGLLKEFTKSNITLELSEGFHGIDPGRLSCDITECITKKFQCDRQAAIRAGEEKLEGVMEKSIRQSFKAEKYKSVYETWSLAFLVLEPKRKFILGDKNLFKKMIHEKAFGTEAEYIKCLQRFLKLFR